MYHHFAFPANGAGMLEAYSSEIIGSIRSLYIHYAVDSGAVAVCGASEGLRSVEIAGAVKVYAAAVQGRIPGVNQIYVAIIAQGKVPEFQSVSEELEHCEVAVGCLGLAAGRGYSTSGLYGSSTQ